MKEATPAARGVLVCRNDTLEGIVLWWLLQKLFSSSVSFQGLVRSGIREKSAFLEFRNFSSWCEDSGARHFLHHRHCEKLSVGSAEVRHDLGSKVLTCHLCPKRFSSKTSLQRHVKTHQGWYAHRCSFCHKGFMTKDHLQGHVASNHTGQRPFACNFCSRTFLYRSHLLEHSKKYHSDVRTDGESLE